MAIRSVLTIRGWVATVPAVRSTPSGVPVTTFRIADTVRRRDPATDQWRDVSTTWYTVEAWGDLGAHVAKCVRASDPVTVIGHPVLDEWVREDGTSASRLVLRADTIGHDLTYGTASFARHMSGVYRPGSEEPPGDSARAGADGSSAAAEGLVEDEVGDELADDTEARAQIDGDLDADAAVQASVEASAA